ncbi:hypothetical protein CERSUDRAFT_119234 [Gelatoporia subvermispora B]|uniref:Wings apart-like protein C-terminal domain-containing protein n=1 Tax=Ceriporiopsis subvermispora (strain B) TaxID=914234 RepID=M2P944_CERS8|nr:hypothetical protein CERSUDRAFT_119234 [Gelatoporia subvermispora B]
MNPRKRAKVEVEVVQATTPSPSKSSMNTSENGDSVAVKQRSASRVHRIASPSASPTKARITYLSRTPSRSNDDADRPLAASQKTILRSDTLLAEDEKSSSPRKPAKALSQLFSFSRSERTPDRSSGVARRMLGRSRTESSIGSPTENRAEELGEGPSTPRKLVRTQSTTTIEFDKVPPSTSREHSLTPSKSHSLENVSSPAMVRPGLASSNVRTYAGKSRSFLVALPTSQLGSLSRAGSMSQGVDDVDSLLYQSQEDEMEVRESYTDLRMRWGVDTSDDNQIPVFETASPSDGSRRKGKGRQMEVEAVSLPSNMMNDLRSITELRSKGESRRFLDEVGYIFEGLESSCAIGVRRGSAMEIITNFCDIDFARKAKAADFMGRTWEMLRVAGGGNGDKVLDTILIVFAALVARDPRDLADLASKSDFSTVLFRMLGSLERRTDPLWAISCDLSDAELRKIGISKAEKAQFINIHRLVRKKSGVLDESDLVREQISCRLLISFPLVALPSWMLEHKHLSAVLRSLSSELDPISARISSYTSGLSIFPSSINQDLLSLHYIDNCLHLLDAFLLGRWSAEDDNDTGHAHQLDAQRQAGLGKALIALCIACDILVRDTQSVDYHGAAQRCLESALRVLINLTHDDLDWCKAALEDSRTILTLMRIIIMCQRRRTSTAVKKGEEMDDGEADYDGSTSSLDRLCLALGLVTNLVQVADDAKSLARDTMLDFHCTGKRGCIGSCSCQARVSTLECLALVYIQHHKSEDHMDTVVRGHMAVLFGLLMQGCLENQNILLGALPGSSRRHKLTSLITNATEFTQFYVEFTKRVSAAVHNQEDEEDQGIHFDMPPSDSSVDKLLRDTKGETVAKNVITFLERLRDRSSR